jgi:hypothetical protein
MLYSETIAVCSEIHTKHINTLCGQNVEFVNVKPGGTYSNHWALEGLNKYGVRESTGLIWLTTGTRGRAVVGTVMHISVPWNCEEFTTSPEAPRSMQLAGRGNIRMQYRGCEDGLLQERMVIKRELSWHS